MDVDGRLYEEEEGRSWAVADAAATAELLAVLPEYYCSCWPSVVSGELREPQWRPGVFHRAETATSPAFSDGRHGR